MPALSESISSLPPLQRRMAEAWLTRFEENWHDQKLRECMRALPPQSSLRRPLLLAMIERDLAHHFEDGRPIGVETYLKEFPEIGPIEEFPVELIAAEYNLRQRIGGADLSEFAQRFPSRIDDLYELIRPNSFETGSNPETPPIDDDSAAERRARLLRTPPNLEAVDPAAARRMQLLRSSVPDLDAPLDLPPVDEVPEVTPPLADPDVFLPPEPDRTDPTKKLDVSPAQTVWLDVETIREKRPAANLPGSNLAAPPMPPPVLGRYQIERRLGSTGLGSIYEAFDTQLERRVALKIPFFTGPDADLERTRFHREARAAAGLSHPLLCPVLDVGQVQGFDYLAMPLVEGDPLHELMKQRPIWPVRQAVDLALKLATALDAAHRHGVVHRHLKPSNVLLAPSETPVIVGFGQWTRPTHNVGNPNAAYVAPELIGGHEDVIGPRIDIYSLGVIFYQVLTGQLPKTPPGRNSKLSFPADLDPALQEICRRAMAFDADDRYTTMRQLLDDLTKYRQALKPSESGTRLTLAGSSHTRLPASSTPGLPNSSPGLPKSMQGLQIPVAPPMLGPPPVAASETFNQMQELRSMSSAAIPAMPPPRPTLWAKLGPYRWLIAGAGGALVVALIVMALSGGGENKGPATPPPATETQQPDEPSPPPTVESVEELLSLLETAAPHDRDDIGERLRKRREPEASDAIVRFLSDLPWSEEHDPKGEVRDVALAVLLANDPLKVPTALKRAAKSEDFRVRSWAYREIARRIDADNKHFLQPVLISGLKDSNPGVRRLVAEQIRANRFNDPEVVAGLASRVADDLWGESGDTHNPRADGGKNAALDTLEEFAPERVDAALNAALRSTNPHVKKWAERQKRNRQD